MAPPVGLNHLDSVPAERAAALGTLPGTFDWRDQGKVTPVKDQRPCGTCWIFGTTSALESAVLIGDNTAYDFSEQSVALCVDRSWVYLYDDSDEPCGISHGGGNSLMATEVFIKKGAVLESCDPYNSSGLQCDGACLCDNCTPVKIVDGYRLVTNNQSQTSLIKEAVYNHGPVTMAFYYAPYFHEYTIPIYGAVYDCATCTDANHLVSVVGWDDSVPHFETPGTGAWLVKNSWGAGWENSGYLWLAYNSSCIGEVAYLEYKNYDPYEKLYYWDEAGFVDDYGYETPSAWMASIFTSTQIGNLTDVDFWATSDNAQYEIYVCLDGDISNGLQNQVASQSGTCQESGYYSIPLTSPVLLTCGQPFAIAVRMTTPGYDSPLPVEEAIRGAVEPEIQDGVSYARHGDADVWEDLATDGCNACLRVRVRSDTEPSIITTHLFDGVVGEVYQETMQAAGGVPPYTWKATGLPARLTCSAAGVISGTPRASGDFTVTVTVTDSSHPASTDSTDLPLKVYPGMVITTTSLPDGELGEAYATTLAAVGGKTPHTWTASGLPVGLNCSAAGIIAGTPVDEVGSFNVTVAATDALGNTASKDLSLVISCRLGDANMDGVVDTGDITKVKRIYFGLDPQTPCADANKDEMIDTGDITAIKIIYFS